MCKIIDKEEESAQIPRVVGIKLTSPNDLLFIFSSYYMYVDSTKYLYKDIGAKS